jgi:hypothetical protein
VNDCIKGVQVGGSCDLPQDSRIAYEIVVRNLHGNKRGIYRWKDEVTIRLNREVA